MINPTSFGSISRGTLRTEDLLPDFIAELEWQIRRNGEHFSNPENFGERDRLNNLVGEAQDCFTKSGKAIKRSKRDFAEELVNETLPDALNLFAPAYSYFGAHCGDGSDFGFWPMDIEEIKSQIEFSSTKAQEFPDSDFSGEWLHVNERGNCTLYVRENGKDKGKPFQDKEIWGVC